MGFFKKVFGEKLPIRDLLEAQERLERSGVTLLCKDVVITASGRSMREFELRDEINNSLGNRFPSFRSHVFSGPDVWQWDCAKVNSVRWISRGDALSIEFDHKKELGPASYIGRQVRRLEEKYKVVTFDGQFMECGSDLDRILDGVRMLNPNVKMNVGDNDAGFLALALAYLGMHPEENALISPEGLAALLIDQDIYSMVGDWRMWRWVQTESYVVGDSINSLALKKHVAVIEALCTALEALTDRGRVKTYEQLDTIVRQKIIELGQEKFAYWQGRIENGKTVSLPLGFFIESYGRGGPISGPMGNCQVIYLCPTIHDVRYGLSVVVTRDGWEHE